MKRSGVFMLECNRNVSGDGFGLEQKVVHNLGGWLGVFLWGSDHRDSGADGFITVFRHYGHWGCFEWGAGGSENGAVGIH